MKVAWNVFASGEKEILLTPETKEEREDLFQWAHKRGPDGQMLVSVAPLEEAVAV